MTYHRVTVFGGSGFLGRQIVKRLAHDGADVRVAVRRPERASSLQKRAARGESPRFTPTCGTKRRWLRRWKAPMR
jgi:uncharacterized protein YbjT (DUF2867 family)